MSSASGARTSDEACPMDVVVEDAGATTSGRNHQEGLSGDVHHLEEESIGSEEELGGDGRTLSSASSDSSVAVNCHAYPTEVVVQGRKVQKVRLVFPPFPPSTSGKEPLTGYPVRRRVASLDRKLAYSHPTGHRRFRPSGSTVAQATDDLRSIPLSQEESSGWPKGELTLVGGVPPVCQEEEARSELEAKMRREVQNGICLIEDSLGGLIRLNQKLRADLENATRNGEVLRETMEATEERLRMAEVENGELKDQLEKKEKEAMRLLEQTKEEWSTRIGLEEKLMELRRDRDVEVASLKDQLEVRNAEVRTLEAELKHRKQVVENRESRSDGVEMAARVNQLEETLRRLQREKEKVDEVASRLEKDIDAWKVKYETRCHDLELQMGRFQALKKSYADLQEESQKLAKTTQRVLRDPFGHSGPAALESIRIIDLPEQTKSGGSLQSQHTGHTSRTPSGGKMAGARDLRIGTRSRKKSQDSASSDLSLSLPPVQKFNK